MEHETTEKGESSDGLLRRTVLRAGALAAGALVTAAAGNDRPPRGGVHDGGTLTRDGRDHRRRNRTPPSARAPIAPTGEGYPLGVADTP